ncbi:AAA family ATPase [Dielma fastidiosa]|uniref:AAA family ATPase n=1 Tax=Dielma fastidiosa TaxID=1034346 RepID=UPI002A80E900|nr:AAA family ATPase [Dielma fastidiosa]
MLYSGAYILAGAPKIGKSFLVAQIAYHISTGKSLWNFDVHQGTVLYLALEDD